VTQLAPIPRVGPSSQSRITCVYKDSHKAVSG
jgi:hypothetical protein